MKVVNINFIGTAVCTQKVLRLMEEQGCGSIVNIASVAGHVPAPFMSSYVSSKHAVVGFTRSLQAELAQNHSPVHLMMVSPGFVNTNILKKGEGLGFPEWLMWLAASPEKVALSIIKGLRDKRQEILPTINGKVMLGMHKFFPGLTVRSSKVLLTKSFKDFLLNRYDV